MNIKCEFSYNGARQERKIHPLLIDKIRNLCSLGIEGEFRCACKGSSDKPLGLLYYGNQSNPEWIVTLSR